MKIPVTLSRMPYYLSAFAEIDENSDSVKVTVESRIHVQKQITMPHTWSIEFYKERHKEFVADVHAFIVKRYGLKLTEPRWE